MKNFLYLMILSCFLYSQEVSLKFPDGKEEFYVKDNFNNYYKNGVITSKTLMKTDNTIIVSFKNIPELESFTNRHNIEFKSWINENSKQAIFKILEKDDIFKVCNDINKENFINFSQPNFIRPRKLK